MGADGFAVEPSVLYSAGADLYDLADTVEDAARLAETELVIKPGGSVLQMLGGEMDAVREDLTDAYAPGGPISWRLYQAGFALRDNAISYEDIDHQEAARFDDLLSDGGSHTVPWTSNRAGVSERAYVNLLSGQPENAFAEYDAFVEISDKVEDIIAFEWIGDIFKRVGLPDPFQPIKDALEGDWVQVGRSLGALKMLISFEDMVGDDLLGMIKQLDSAWSGNAASAAMVWIKQFADAMRKHKNALNKQGQRIKAEALAFKSNLDNLFDIVDIVQKAIPTPADMLDLVTDPIGGVQRLAKRLAKYAELIKEAFDLALGAAFALVAAISQITRFWDAEFPSVPNVPHADVDGPRR